MVSVDSTIYCLKGSTSYEFWQYKPSADTIPWVFGDRPNREGVMADKGALDLSRPWLVAYPNPTRIAAQVVSGIGFLGGGVILREGLNVKGMTTAATLWCSAAVGTLAGAGFVIEALIGTATILAANFCLLPVSRWLVSGRSDIASFHLPRSNAGR